MCEERLVLSSEYIFALASPTQSLTGEREADWEYLHFVFVRLFYSLQTSDHKLSNFCIVKNFLKLS